ncbi:uncharacterized protein RHO25_009007 [Cercospora beticola]|uniref:Transmembrane protein n=1 Tax=Cercospora beticola TaxID=122368 RepID=A0ABZ0NXW3_CERBT|nr:hypothetical protein RHO25_009007 [Cercospora beticola]
MSAPPDLESPFPAKALPSACSKEVGWALTGVQIFSVLLALATMTEVLKILWDPDKNARQKKRYRCALMVGSILGALSFVVLNCINLRCHISAEMAPVQVSSFVLGLVHQSASVSFAAVAWRKACQPEKPEVDGIPLRRLEQSGAESRTENALEDTRREDRGSLRRRPGRSADETPSHEEERQVTVAEGVNRGAPL